MSLAKNIRNANRKRYQRAPTWKQIEKVIQRTGMNKYHFELFYGINYNHLAQVKQGTRELSKSYWHIIYEFGKRPKKSSKIIPVDIPKTKASTEYFHERFAILK